MSLAWLLRRVALIALTLLVVSFLVFAATQILPGNAAAMILGENATPDQLAALSRQLGLDRPWPVQYADWLAGVLRGQLGQSLALSTPVADLLGQALVRSLVLAGATLLVVACVGLSLGVAGSVYRGTWVDLLVSLVATLGVALPEFVTATLLLVFLAGPENGLFPSGGYVPLADGVGPFLAHMALPVAALSLVLLAHVSRQVRSEMSDVLRRDYVRTAILKGLPRRTVLRRHALRNALAPAIAVLALDVGYLLGGILVVEEVFAWPGLGRLLVFALQNRDLPLIQAGTLLIASVYAGANLAADIAYAALDRRVQYA
ncbi:MAG: ABC transporter permease [Acetobacteraceae bacterium]|nr:ABC transporter permease [Acetobacteraceae bacterium]